MCFMLISTLKTNLALFDVFNDFLLRFMCTKRDLTLCAQGLFDDLWW